MNLTDIDQHWALIEGVLCISPIASIVDNVTAVFISKSDGERIAGIVDNGTKVMMHISVGKRQTTTYKKGIF